MAAFFNKQMLYPAKTASQSIQSTHSHRPEVM